jgi:hypothetical protein
MNPMVAAARGVQAKGAGAAGAGKSNDSHHLPMQDIHHNPMYRQPSRDEDGKSTAAPQEEQKMEIEDDSEWATDNPMLRAGAQAQGGASRASVERSEEERQQHRKSMKAFGAGAKKRASLAGKRMSLKKGRAESAAAVGNAHEAEVSTTNPMQASAAGRQLAHTRHNAAI